MKVSAEISEPKTSPVTRLNNVQALQEKIDEEVVVTALRIATVTAQDVPVDEGTLRNSYHVLHSKSSASNPNPLPSPPDKVTAVVGSVLEYAPVIEARGGRGQIGQGAFMTAYGNETAGFPKRIATIVKNYLDGK